MKTASTLWIIPGGAPPARTGEAPRDCYVVAESFDVAVATWRGYTGAAARPNEPAELARLDGVVLIASETVAGAVGDLFGAGERAE